VVSFGIWPLYPGEEPTGLGWFNHRIGLVIVTRKLPVRDGILTPNVHFAVSCSTHLASPHHCKDPSYQFELGTVSYICINK
jgi:hypothetical protein